MNEQEKQAIDWLKEELDDEKKSHKNCNHSYKGVTGLYGNNEVEIALKLIEKQQKEIEELKDEYKREVFEYQEFVEDTKVAVQDYIEKYKIKDLIKEKAKTDTYNFKTIAVKDIEELLGG